MAGEPCTLMSAILHIRTEAGAAHSRIDRLYVREDWIGHKADEVP